MISKGLPPNRNVKEMVMYGNPEQVKSQVKEFEDAGVEYLIFSSPLNELESLRLFGEKIIPEFV